MPFRWAAIYSTQKVLQYCLKSHNCYWHILEVSLLRCLSSLINSVCKKAYLLSFLDSHYLQPSINILKIFLLNPSFLCCISRLVKFLPSSNYFLPNLIVSYSCIMPQPSLCVMKFVSPLSKSLSFLWSLPLR